MFVDMKLWGTERCICSASHSLLGEAATEHKAVEARRNEPEPCLRVACRQPGGCMWWWWEGVNLSLGIGLHAIETIKLAPEKGIYFFRIPWNSRQSRTALGPVDQVFKDLHPREPNLQRLASHTLSL